MVKSFKLQWPYFVTVVSVVLAFGICDTTVGNITVAVNRRSGSSGDIRYMCNNIICSTPWHCYIRCPVSTTYLVAGQQCVSNSNLLNECPYVINPTGNSHPLRFITVAVNGTSRLETFNGSEAYANTTVTIIQNGIVNSSFCHISSLEVYRGRQQAIMISHEGLSLGNSGTIEVNESQLAYNSTEYDGELYRMNISCNSSDSENSTDSTLPINGCLFFKVFGITAITDAKFMCKVPGTISNCTQTMTIPEINTETTTPQSLQSLSPMTTTPTVTEESQMNNNNQLALETGSPLFYGLVVAGSTIILILLLCVIGVLILACRRQYATVTLEPNTCQRNPAYIQLGPVNGSQADLVSGSYSENPAYNINARTSSYQEPSYEVIPSDTDGTSRTVQGTQNIHYNPNPAYIHLGVHVEENFQADPTAPSDCSQNPAYGIHSNTN